MPSATRTTEQIRDEIEERFGFFPPFFAPALGSPQVLENLWQQTLSAYVENPLSALFKERLSALLSRFCAAPYFMIVHSAALRPLGMTARQVLALMDPLPSDDQGNGLPLGVLPVPTPEEAASPAADSPLEKTLLYCATSTFLELADAPMCQAELFRLLRLDLYPHLVAYLAYIKTCHTWIEAHPDISYKADQRAVEHLGPLLAEEPALAEFFRHYQERGAGVQAGRVTQAERARADQTIRDSEEKLRLLVDGARDYAMILLDPEGRVTSWNMGAERILGWAEAEVLGQPADLIFTPEDRDAGVPARELETAASQSKSMDLRWHIKKDGSRFFADGVMEGLRDGQGRLRGFAKILRDATERAERERRERFLADLAERARGMKDPDKVIADAVRSVGEFLGVSRCAFADIDIEGDTCTVRPDFHDGALASMAGGVPISAFGPFLVAEFLAGRVVAVDDVRADPVRVPPDTLAAYEAVGIRAFVAAPVVHSDRLVSNLACHSAAPRRWTPEEVELLQAVVERTWLVVEVLRQQQALAREAEELRAAHERTTDILESITDAFMAFDTDWRFTYVNDQSERIMARRREDLLGRVFWDEFPAVGSTFEREYRRAVDEQTSVSFEEFYPPLNVWVEVRAYPSSGGLSVFYQDVTARKALEAERERLAERERNIAQQLQAALTPLVPERIPGMALAKHYEAALDEAGVGGDFYDVFPMDKGCTALVVGDLSGKGLAAASQVATVRNMLRYALYRARTLAGALDGLNALLAEQRLLTGFATLFVGAYDSGAGTLTYVNCGQEPALVRRAGTGLVEHLIPTGPVLGSFGGAAFEEQTVALGPGDALAVFTDGLTEVGSSRIQMLNIEGVADLLAGAVAPEEADRAEAVAEHLALRLIAGVDAAAAGGVTRDDVCLLVAVVDA